IKGVKIFLENLSYSVTFEGILGATVNRKYFDELLAKKAVQSGAELVEQSFVFEPVLEKGCVCGVKYKILENGRIIIKEARAQVTIIAEGASSLLTRILSVFNRQQVIRAVNTVCEPLPETEREHFEFYFDKTLLPGYFWYFPFVSGKEYGFAGFGIEKKINLQREYYKLHDKYLSGTKIFEKPQTWVIPCDYPKKVAGDGWIITGDAAGLANPVTGEGIYYAVKSGEFAALTVIKALEKGNYSLNTLKEYKILIDDRFKKEYNLSKVIKKLIPLGFHKAFFSSAARKKGVLEKFMAGEMNFNGISIKNILKYLFVLPLAVILFYGCGSAPAVISEKKPHYPPYQSYLHYSKGALLSRNWFFEEAIEEYKKALALDPESEIISQTLAAEYTRIGKTGEALKIYDKLSALSGDLKTLLQSAAFYIEHLKFSQAIAVCNRILQKEPKNPDAYFYLGNIYYKQDKPDEAIDMFNKVIELDPKADTTYFNLGLAYGKKGDFELAEKNYKKAAEVNPEYTSPIFALGLLFQIQGKPEKAVEEYKKLLALSDYDARAYKNIGLAYGQMKKYKEAVENLKKAVELDPSDLDSLQRIALMLYQEKDYKGSLEHARRLAVSDPANAEAYQIMGSNYNELGKNNEAVEAYEKFVELTPKNPSGYIYLSYLYTKRNEYPKMIALLEKGVRILPENIDLQLYLGGAYFENKNYIKAETAYREVLKRREKDDRTLYSLGVLLERTARYEEAVYCFKQVIEINPKYADAYNYAGYIYADRNEKLDEAMSLIMKALKLEPENGAYIDSLGWIYYRLGKFDEAQRELERAALILKKAGHDDPIVFEHLGDIYLKKNLYAKAEEMYEKSLKQLENASVRRKLDELKKTKSE
ncbi:MAG: tetratricopeptide repeat protein, partial [Candidatus Firestonebacteria bacterium]